MGENRNVTRLTRSSDFQIIRSRNINIKHNGRGNSFGTLKRIDAMNKNASKASVSTEVIKRYHPRCLDTHKISSRQIIDLTIGISCVIDRNGSGAGTRDIRDRNLTTMEASLSHFEHPLQTTSIVTEHLCEVRDRSLIDFVRAKYQLKINWLQLTLPQLRAWKGRSTQLKRLKIRILRFDVGNTHFVLTIRR